jgi:ankyrin repeat protein
VNSTKVQRGIKNNLPIPPRDELWEAIKKKNLSKYTPEQIEKGMLQRGLPCLGPRFERNGRNLYHEAALKGHLDLIPKELLTAENLLKPDEDGQTCFHFAASRGHLGQIPQELLTNRNLHLPDQYGWNGFQLAAANKHLHQIPKELLTEETLIQLLTEETHSLEGEGQRFIHLLAQKGSLDQIPKEILMNGELLKEKYEDQWGQSWLHSAAEYGHLDQVPREILTEETLLQKDLPVLDLAARNKHLDQIPPLTISTLRAIETYFSEEPENEIGKNILEWAGKRIAAHVRRQEALATVIKTLDHPSL